MINEFLHGSGDMHSLCAYMVYTDKIPRDTPIKDIKKLFPHERKEVKGVEFSQQFGGSEYAIQNALGCSMETAMKFKKAYNEGFPGIADFKKKGAAFVKKNGYIVMCRKSGHRMNWYRHDKWLEEQNSYTQEFWEEYRAKHKGTGDYVAQAVSNHAKIGSKWERYALNAPTQGTGSVIMKHAMVLLYRWIVKNDLFNTVKLCAIVHDEACIEYPESMPRVADRLKEFMEKAAAVYCTSLPIPAEAAVGKHWIH